MHAALAYVQFWLNISQSMENLIRKESKSSEKKSSVTQADPCKKLLKTMVSLNWNN